MASVKYWIDLGVHFGEGGAFDLLEDAVKAALAYAKGEHLGCALPCVVRRADNGAAVLRISRHYYDELRRYHPAVIEETKTE